MKHKKKHHTKSKRKHHTTSKSNPQSKSKSRPTSRSTSAYSKLSSVNSKSNSVKPEEWRSRTTTEKLLIPVSLLLLALSVILLVVIIMLATTTASSKNEPQVCSTTGCVQASHYFLHAMNTSVDPCTDFFEFSCGEFVKKNIGKDTTAVIKTQQLTHIRALLKKNVTSESKAINMARILYQSCMNTAQIEELKSRPIFEAISSLGKWPLLETNWDKSSITLTDFLVLSARLRANPFYKLTVIHDFSSENSSKNIFQTERGTVSINSGIYYLDPVKYAKEMSIYREYFQKIVQLLKTDGNIFKSDDEINGDIDKVIAFEAHLAKILIPDENSDSSYKLKTLNLYTLMPIVDWVDFIKQSVPSDLAHLINNETEILVKDRNYMVNLSKLLQSTDANIITNYIIWWLVQYNTFFVDERFRTLTQYFQNVVNGRPNSPRWSDCIEITNMFLPMATSAMYVEAHFRENDKQEALDMVLDLKSSFLEMLQQNDWIDEETKAEAIAKLNAMGQFVGYEDDIKDLKKLDDNYSGLEINQGDSIFKVIKQTVAWSDMMTFNKLLKPSNKTDPASVPLIVNAFYTVKDNFMDFPAGILQPPLFSGIFPKAVNYGAIGAVIGHEMTHGFDDEGSKYDKEGKIRNWWSNSSLEAFNKKTVCIVDQYGSYEVPGTTYKINGVMTQGETIADNGGLRVAFRAYQKYVKEHGEEPRLPGFKQYSNEQILFLSFAQYHCGKREGASLLFQILNDPHPPGEFRVNGAVSNMKEFADAFNCPKNSPSNPDHKCVVW